MQNKERSYSLLSSSGKCVPHACVAHPLIAKRPDYVGSAPPTRSGFDADFVSFDVFSEPIGISRHDLSIPFFAGKDIDSPVQIFHCDPGEATGAIQSQFDVD